MASDVSICSELTMVTEAQHDKQIAAIRRLIREGNRLMAEARRDMAQFRTDMRRLTAAQKETDQSLKALIKRWQPL